MPPTFCDVRNENFVEDGKTSHGVTNIVNNKYKPI